MKKLIKKLFSSKTEALEQQIQELKAENAQLLDDKNKWKEAWWQMREHSCQNRHYLYLLGYSDHKRGFAWDARRDIVSVIAKEQIKKELQLNE